MAPLVATLSIVDNRRTKSITSVLFSLLSILWLLLFPFQNVFATDSIHATSRTKSTSTSTSTEGSLTLREYLLHEDGFYLGMGPAFFGFYGYFGALAAWEEENLLPASCSKHEHSHTHTHPNQNQYQHPCIHGVAGASAGAMAAILLAAGIAPQRAADFCTNISLWDFADGPGLLSMFRGEKFQQLMEDFMRQEISMIHGNNSNNSSNNVDFLLDLANAQIPVAVSAFDLQQMRGRLLQHGNMARAARASACFPFLFQPVGWWEDTFQGHSNSNSKNNDAMNATTTTTTTTTRNSVVQEYYLLVDGGISDMEGMAGLAALQQESQHELETTNIRPRMINMVVGDFLGSSAPGPTKLFSSHGVNTSTLLSISIQNLPICGPWNMKNGPLAVDAARRAMKAFLDIPLEHGEEDGHYLLRIDASSYR